MVARSPPDRSDRPDTGMGCVRAGEPRFGLEHRHPHPSQHCEHGVQQQPEPVRRALGLQELVERLVDQRQPPCGVAGRLEPDGEGRVLGCESRRISRTRLLGGLQIWRVRDQTALGADLSVEEMPREHVQPLGIVRACPNLRAQVTRRRIRERCKDLLGAHKAGCVRGRPQCRSQCAPAAAPHAGPGRALLCRAGVRQRPGASPSCRPCPRSAAESPGRLRERTPDFPML